MKAQGIVLILLVFLSSGCVSSSNNEIYAPEEVDKAIRSHLVVNFWIDEAIDYVGVLENKWENGEKIGDSELDILFTLLDKF